MAERRVIDELVTRVGFEPDTRSQQRALGAVDKVRGAMNKLALGAGLLGTALTASTAGFVKKFAGVETGLAKMEGLVGISARALEDTFAPAIDRLALKFGVLPDAMGAAAFFITSAGQRGAQAIDTMTYAAAGQAAELGNIATLAKLATAAQTAYGKANLNNAKIFNVLAHSVREGTFETDEMSAVIGNLLPIASNMKVRFSEIAGALAAMSRTGSDAHTAATQLNQIMASLLNPSAEAAKAIESIGLSVKDVQDSVSERGLLATVKMLQDSLPEEQFINIFGNIRALRGVLDLLGANYEETQGIISRTESATTTFDEALAAQSRTINFQFNRAQAAMSVGMIKVGGGNGSGCRADAGSVDSCDGNDHFPVRGASAVDEAGCRLDCASRARAPDSRSRAAHRGGGAWRAGNRVRCDQRAGACSDRGACAGGLDGDSVLRASIETGLG